MYWKPCRKLSIQILGQTLSLVGLWRIYRSMKNWERSFRTRCENFVTLMLRFMALLKHSNFASQVSFRLELTTPACPIKDMVNKTKPSLIDQELMHVSTGFLSISVIFLSLPLDIICMDNISSIWCKQFSVTKSTICLGNLFFLLFPI